MTLINDGYFHKILDHTDLSPCQSLLFQQGEVLLRLKGFPVFLHRSMQCLGFPDKAAPVQIPLAGRRCLLQVDVQRLCFGYLHFVTVLEKREGEADYYSVEWSSGFRVPAIAEFQLSGAIAIC